MTEPDSVARALALIKPGVRAAPPYALRAPEAPRKLNQNESPFDAPPAVKAAILRALRDEPWHRYPPFAPAELLARLAARHAWVPDGVLVGNGSNELIQATLAVTVGADTPVVTPVPLAPAFAFDVDALVAAARAARARVIVVNSPNNPTGTPLPEGAVERLLAETEALVVVDEAYQDFGGPTAVPLLAREARLVVLRTFSKAMALAGLRFGYALAHPAVAAEIAKAKLPYNVNRVTLAAAAAVLDAADVLAERARAVARARDRLAALLGRVPGLVVFPSAANFVLVRCERPPAGEVFERLVREHGILVRDVSAGPGLAGCLRITVGSDDDVDAVARALEAICR